LQFEQLLSERETLQSIHCHHKSLIATTDNTFAIRRPEARIMERLKRLLQLLPKTELQMMYRQHIISYGLVGL
jgi:hypothetical protein